MVEQSFIRRSSYGPTSPNVGTRGARTRQQIVDAALQCFTLNGFHDTSVDDICAVAETSRATLYQYFESREAIFIELMHESGGALHRVTKGLGPLGPSTDGYGHLHRWLGEWSQVFERFSGIFIEWANVNSPKAPLRSKLAEFVDTYTDQFVPKLEAAGYAGPDTTAAAILTLALMNRFNYIHHVYQPGIGDAELLDSLAIALQLFLFPETDVSILAAGPRSGDPVAVVGLASPPIRNMGPLATLPARQSIVRANPFDGLSPQATRTVRQLLDAAERVFAANGYTATNVDQIVTEAGLARGTFYRYFSEKLELMIAVAHEAASVMCPLFADFECFGAEPDPDDLRHWLGEFLATQRRYSGVLRAWTEGFPIDPALLAPAADVVAALGKAVTATLPSNRPYPLHLRAAGMMMASILEHFPDEGTGCRHEPSDDTIVETEALFIERALLAR